MIDLNKLRKLAGILSEDVNQFYTSCDEIKNWLDENGVENYNINDDLTVDVNGDVQLPCRNFSQLPVKFGEVIGRFNLFQCKNLLSLAGCPKKVGKWFGCHECDSLTSLKGGPEYVGEMFHCHSCPNLTSLVGAPLEVGSWFTCNNCPKLVSLKGLPLVIGSSLNIDKKFNNDKYLQYCQYGSITNI